MLKFYALTKKAERTDLNTLLKPPLQVKQMSFNNPLNIIEHPGYWVYEDFGGFQGRTGSPGSNELS